MNYREFGNTGVMISALGFGTMRLPMVRHENGDRHVDEDKAIAVLHRAFELGVNYVDTAYMYCSHESEIVVGKALKGWRDKVYLSTKVPTGEIRAKGDYTMLLEEQLKKLDTDHIDFYHFHGLSKDSWENIVLKYDAVQEAVNAKEQGLIRHISFSFHDAPQVLMDLVDTGIFESVLCQYNLLDRSNEEAIAYAASRGLGVVIMGPVGGGRLAMPSQALRDLINRDVKSTPEVALRFVLGNKNVSCALSGMSTLEMVEENVRVASRDDELSEEEWADVSAALEENKRLAELYCTGCDYCMPCPNGVNISHNFRLMNYYRVYGLKEYARDEYAKLAVSEERAKTRAENCIECGACETKCPQKIQIRRQLRETAEALR